jgi:penicillin V acylase-like amidase (Ntn superfamily)
MVVAPLHAIKVSDKSFQWGKNQHKYFDEIKLNISQAPILTFPNLHKLFEVETDASGYVMGVVLMEGGKLVCYHSKMFHRGLLNYPTYDKELYTLVQFVKNINHYLMGKETIIHIEHQPL